MISDVRVVRLRPDDWQEFRDVRLASLADAPGAFGSRHADWVEVDEARWRSRLVDVPLTVVARVDGAPVGVVCGAPGDGEVELISMWVAPGHRGTGLARRLIDAVVAWSTVRGQETVLMVRDDNAPAIEAYRRAGFIDEGVPADSPADAAPERRMRWVGPVGTLVYDRHSTSAGDDVDSHRREIPFPVGTTVGVLLDWLLLDADVPARSAVVPWTWVVLTPGGALAVLDASQAQRILPLVDPATPLVEVMGGPESGDWRVWLLYLTQRDPDVVVEEERARWRGELTGQRVRY